MSPGLPGKQQHTHRVGMNIPEKLAALSLRAPWIAEGPLRRRLKAVVQNERDPIAARARVIQIATEASEALAPIAACRQGCSHCCHQGLILYEHEAVRLAEASGREMVRQPWRRRQEVDGDIASSIVKPCPFLVEHSCSVHEHRPLSCRLRHSLSDEPDDCSLDGRTRGEFLALSLESAFIDTYAGLSAVTSGVEPLASIHRYFPE